MNLPAGTLRRRRVVTDFATPLANALDEALTGYARLEPQDTLLLDTEGVGVVVFEDGIPTLAYHTGTDAGGPDALSDIAVAGPCRVELYELADPLDAEAASDLCVPPGLPAERLASASKLAARTRDRAPDRRLQDDPGSELDALETFLDDEQRIETLQDRAREEAVGRADEWGFDIDT